MVTLVYSVQSEVFWYSFLSGWTFLLCMLLDPILLAGLLKNAELVESPTVTKRSFFVFLGNYLGYGDDFDLALIHQEDAGTQTEDDLMASKWIPFTKMLLFVLALSLSMLLRVANMETCFFASTR